MDKTTERRDKEMRLENECRARRCVNDISSELNTLSSYLAYKLFLYTIFDSYLIALFIIHPLFIFGPNVMLRHLAKFMHWPTIALASTPVTGDLQVWCVDPRLTS